jgi:hypothetical protein
LGSASAIEREERMRNVERWNCMFSDGENSRRPVESRMADGDSVVSAAEAYIIGPRARVECSPLQAGHSGI